MSSMVLDDVAYLVSVQITKNVYQQEVQTEKLRRIYCRRDGITRVEFYNAGKQDLKPAFMLTTAQIDYNSETEIVYNEERYGIYRTYPKGDYIELYCEEKGGAVQ